ncbi:MAG TPA: ChbG/HpnK family deacetylase [Blastocatellia bacterium]|nr:ChbG/HpnK family deacetylase [Blastocatellia bacterium]
MKRLIVNADDFGFTRGVNAGIAHAYKMGILTSATIMANGDAFEDAVEVARANSGLGLGCHLSAVGGRPVAPARDVASLVDGDGMLPATLTRLMIKLARGQVRSGDIESEFRAQVGRVVGAGIRPTHLDSHKHSHTHPQVMRALARVAREFGIRSVRNPFESLLASPRAGATARARRAAYLKQCAMSAAISVRAISFKRLAREYGLRTPDYFFGMRLTGLLDGEALRGLIKSTRHGTTELMCHPAVYDQELERAGTRLKRERERELEALTDPALRRLIEEEGVDLISYRELGQRHA